jgi:histidinol-phosphate aminotransferase
MTEFFNVPMRSELRGRTPYGSPQPDAAVRLNVNENPHSLPAEVVEEVEKSLRGTLRDLNRYPDRDAMALREDIAAYLGHGLGADQIWPANGSNEVQQQLLQVFGGPGREAIGFAPSYSMHSRLAMSTATGWVEGHRNASFDLTVEAAMAQVRVYQPDVVFLSSPNNPTGTALPIEVIDAVCSEAPGIVIVDEAYAEFARPGTHSALTLLPRYPRLVVTRTMSKAFAFAGVRVGYLAASAAIVDAVQLVRLPYHLSTLTQAAARAALAHAPMLLAQVESIKEQRDRIVSSLRALGLTVADSDANFVLYGRFADAQAVWRGLLERGVLVRDVGLPGWLRVTAGTAAEVSAFLSAMETVPAHTRSGP